MPQLLLLRHAKSSWDDPGMADHARPLNARGQRAAAAMRGAIGRLGLAPELVLVSSARRTLQTAEALEPWETPPRKQPLDSLYLASMAQLLDVLREVDPGLASVLVIAHNPGLHDLARQLDPGDDAAGARLEACYPTAALAQFELAGPWSHLRPGGARLQRFLCPADLPEMAE